MPLELIAIKLLKNQRSEFPERPTSLRKFLLGLQQGWNISLFNYRNHGGGTINAIQFDLHTHSFTDVSKVLAGVQVPPSDYDAFDSFLKNLNYIYVEETTNPIYKRYLLTPGND